MMAASHSLDKPEMLDQPAEVIEVDVGVRPPAQYFGEQLAVLRHMTTFLLFLVFLRRTAEFSGGDVMAISRHDRIVTQNERPDRRSCQP
jgi:hypothetical protein